MPKFTIFSLVPNIGGLRRTEVEEIDDDGVRHLARIREVMEDEVTYDIVQTDCQETGKRLRQVEYRTSKRGRW